MLDELLLLSGNDIPFISAKATIHQPRLKEIAYITQEKFWHAYQLLKFNKNILSDKDKIGLQNQSNFNIIMSMIQERNIQAQQAKLNFLGVLALLFPEYMIEIQKDAIKLTHSQTQEESFLNESNYEQFKSILIDMFGMTSQGQNKQYNPSGSLAEKIANKLRKGREKRAELAPAQKFSLLSRYVSILAVGERKDINELMNYTVYQLMDEYNRFQLKTRYDAWFKIKIAGGSGMDDPEDWLKDIHQKK